MSKIRMIPAREARAEIKISNSTFIATAGPTFSVDQAKKAIQNIKKEYHDATHNVPVYIIGHPPSVIEHSSDDGEPAGTAGRPALSVLRGSGLGDITVVINRYFGGTKLGTGGLVRAYSDSVREVLAKITRAQKIATVTTRFTIPYPLYDQLQRIVSTNTGTIIDQTFETEVTLSIKFAEDNFPDFQNAITQLTNGQIIPQVTSSNPNDVIEV